MYIKRRLIEADLAAIGVPPPRFDWFLAFKNYFSSNGPIFVFIWFVTSICLLAYSLSVAEREYQPQVRTMLLLLLVVLLPVLLLTPLLPLTRNSAARGCWAITPSC